MNSQTSLIVKNYRLQQWAVQINECRNHPKEMTLMNGVNNTPLQKRIITIV